MQTRSSASPQARARAELARRDKLKSYQRQDQLAAFQIKYWSDPIAWARDCIDWRDSDGLAGYQEDAIKHLPIKRRVSIRGPHGLGKTALAALVILWFATTRDGTDWKCVTTASAWRQLTKYLWPEIHKWVRRIRWEKIGRMPFKQGVELLDLSMKLHTGEAFAVASDNSDLIEGAHADHLLYVFDEAKAIPVDTWDAAEGAFSIGNCMALAISTPGEPQGRFYDIQRRAPGYQDWWTRAVTKDESIAAGRMDKKWAEARKKQWGEGSAVYINRVLGNFAASDEDGLIPLSAIERANARWQAMTDAAEDRGDEIWGELLGIGCDVGRGGDFTVVSRLHKNNTIKSLERSRSRNLMEITGVLAGILKRHVDCKVVLDIVGIGAGVYDKLREDDENELRLIPFNAGTKTELTDESGEIGFADLRSAGWWNLREMLLDPDVQVALPPDDQLTGDLTAPRHKMTSGGKIKVESKDEIKKRIGRSTDDGDAVMMALIMQKLDYLMPQWDTIG